MFYPDTDLPEGSQARGCEQGCMRRADDELCTDVSAKTQVNVNDVYLNNTVTSHKLIAGNISSNATRVASQIKKGNTPR
jgi:hypothetical protein